MLEEDDDPELGDDVDIRSDDDEVRPDELLVPHAADEDEYRLSLALDELEVPWARLGTAALASAPAASKAAVAARTLIMLVS